LGRRKARARANALKVRSDLGELEKVRRFLRENLEAFEISEEDFYKIELSLVEMCTNVMRYAYAGADGDISIETWTEAGRFYIELRDDGVPFDPSRVRKPTLKEMISKNQRGGLGIFLARRLMDGFAYRREDGQNILTMFKKVAERKA
jgi:anti-sigma regulatory factor (Ser/Thr protein kinase)